jgi:hypothetical protein
MRKIGDILQTCEVPKGIARTVADYFRDNDLTVVKAEWAQRMQSLESLLQEICAKTE